MASLGENKLVLCGKPQMINLAAVTNDNIAVTDEQILAPHAIVDQGYAALDTNPFIVPLIFPFSSIVRRIHLTFN